MARVVTFNSDKFFTRLLFSQSVSFSLVTVLAGVIKKKKEKKFSS